jgi:hypothetical protein
MGLQGRHWRLCADTAGVFLKVTLTSAQTINHHGQGGRWYRRGPGKVCGGPDQMLTEEG